MLFTSHLFIFAFVPAAVAICAFAQYRYGRVAAVIAMIVLSLLFYYSNSRAQISVLLLSIVFNSFLILFLIRAESRLARALIFAALVAGNLACLGYYKYGKFIMDQLGYSVASEVAADFYTLALPLGISFFTFQQIAYVADLHAGRVKQHKFLDYVFCVTFFPHLIAGPIVNYRELIPQLQNRRLFRFNSIDVAVGVSVFILGLAKKTVLADSFASYVGPAFSAADAGRTVSFWSAWMGVTAYTFQIYFDFSGYSDMAIGLARIFGVQLPANFASPYKSTSIIDFWRRWHITLSRFLRQYLYIPLGGNRHGRFLRYVNLMITMLLGGLWHGAAWNFVLWGAIHGLYLVVNHAWRAVFGGWKVGSPGVRRLLTVLSITLTFFCVMFAWVLFRAETFTGAMRLYEALISPVDGIRFNLLALSGNDWQYVGLLAAGAFIVFFLPNTQEFFYRYRVSIRPDWLKEYTRPIIAWRATYPWLLAFAILGGFAAFYQTEFPQFLYWGF